MQFGVFDHVDDSGLPLAEHLAARLDMIAAYDACGLDCYHVAEHHGTPLGQAPSPGLLLAAASQRTQRIGLGPLVFLLPLYHPLRLIEDVAMLDALTGGRLQLGVGRGVSPIEMEFYGIDLARQKDLFRETLAILRQGLASERLSYAGEFFRFDDVPMTVRPVQQPHPPLWYGTSTPDSIAWCAREGINCVTLALGDKVRDLARVFHDTCGDAPAPLFGISRHIVVAPTEGEAQDLAAGAYARWRSSLVHLWQARGFDFPLGHIYPPDWAAAEGMGHGRAGTADSVAEFVAAEAARGISYFASWFAFGNLRAAQVIRSAQLFMGQVVPAAMRAKS